ncbi:glycosyltransferase family 2 protein [Candidatus Uhrbacteria bacterium]|nr:glycosyltransferase family 2 protein [Candidatus Uhrbacteria bacterium]
MNESFSIWVVIPAYNEEHMIGKVVREVASFVSAVLVVDDFSRDATAMQAAEAGARVTLKQGADIIVHFDADGQHSAQDIPSLIQPIREEKVDIVLGSRFLKKNDIPFVRRLFLQGAILFTWFFSGILLTDAQNGLRAFSRKGAQAVIIKENRFAHASEIIHHIAQSKLRYVEIPATVRYTKYSVGRGDSSVKRMLQVVGRLVWKKLFAD